jgi:hypothetical protein
LVTVRLQSCLLLMVSIAVASCGVGACGGALMDRHPWSFHASPLRLIDPSGGPEDADLEATLRAALFADSTQDEQASASPYEGELYVGLLTEAEFFSRLRAVNGWTLVAIYPAYEDGLPRSDLDDVHGWWLRHRLAVGAAPQADGYYSVLVVRDESVVCRLLLRGHHRTALPRGVAMRAP